MKQDPLLLLESKKEWEDLIYTCIHVHVQCSLNEWFGGIKIYSRLSLFVLFTNLFAF